ncbi:hypothetical protein [Moraxella bovis]|uniref:hypothetical protein n=1 Tax=Moraxella bovis TaxID=476 RepID=UPI00099402BB|nr:hypothetical protein [Moraxella bovis]OOR87963.1 hypothetical protein B0182_11115 [Moraxella bovis]
MKTSFIISIILLSLFITGCTEDERRELLEIVKNATMSESEKRAKRQAEEYARKQEEMEYIHSERYNNLLQRAEPEIRKIIAESLRKQEFPYSKIVIYDGYIHSPSNAKTPDKFTYSYKVDFYADIIQDDIFTIRTHTVTGFVNFDFNLDSQDSYSVNGYEYKVVNVTNDFSDITKIGAKTLFEKLTENNESY